MFLDGFAKSVSTTVTHESIKILLPVFSSSIETHISSSIDVYWIGAQREDKWRFLGRSAGLTGDLISLISVWRDRR